MTPPYRKALVTGGAGFIGSRLARALLAHGIEVTVLDDLSMGVRANVPDGAHLLVGNVCSRDDLAQALEGAEIVFHQAARVSVRASVKEFYQDADTNFMGTLNLLRCCSGSSVRKLVFASSMAVYAEGDAQRGIREDHPTEPISPYGIAKLAAEKYCLQLAREMGIDCHVLRYFNTFGSGQAFTPYVGVITIFIRRLLQGQQPDIFGDGEQRRDFVHVDDIVAANLLSMRSALPAGVFNVGTGRATSVNDLCALLCARIAPAITPRHLPAQASELRHSIADIGHIAAGLGFAPTATLEGRIDEVIAYQRGVLARA